VLKGKVEKKGERKVAKERAQPFAGWGGKGEGGRAKEEKEVKTTGRTLEPCQT